MNGHPSFISRQVREGTYFFFDLDPPTRDETRAVCGGWEACLPTYRIDRADFPYLSLEFVTAGEGWVTLGGRRFGLNPGTIFHYGPGLPHQIESAAEAPLEKYFVDFVGERARRILEDAPFSELQPLSLANPAPARRLFDELNVTGASGSVHAQRICSLLIELLLFRLAEAAVPSDHARSMAWSSFERCRRFIQENYLSVGTLDEVSAACHVDKSYLCRLFRRFGSETPYHMLTRLKVDRAAELLLHSDMLVKEVAEAVHFEDPYHFSRVFARLRGVPPTRFAENARRRLAE